MHLDLITKISSVLQFGVFLQEFYLGTTKVKLTNRKLKWYRNELQWGEHGLCCGQFAGL